MTRSLSKIAARRCRLLYVEDNTESLAVAERIIGERRDVELLHAASTELGLKLARSKRPEVILVCIDLPGASGLEFMKTLRADPASQATPILALSANAAPGALLKALEAGFFQYLTKPLRAEPFLEALAYAREFVAVERAEQATFPNVQND